MATQILPRELFMTQGYDNGKWKVRYFEAVGSEDIAHCKNSGAKCVTGDEKHEAAYQQFKEAANHG